MSRPEPAWLPMAMRRSLEDVAAAGCQLGVISSSSLADLRRRIDIPGVWLAGSGGLELWTGTMPGGAQSLIAGAVTIAAYARDVAPAIDRLPGAWLEQKPLGLTIHHRGASPDTVTAVSEFIAAVGDDSPGLMDVGNDLNDAEAMAEVTRRGGWVIAVGDDARPAHTRVSAPGKLRELLVTLGSALGPITRGRGTTESLR